VELGRRGRVFHMSLPERKYSSAGEGGREALSTLLGRERLKQASDKKTGREEGQSVSTR